MLQIPIVLSFFYVGEIAFPVLFIHLSFWTYLFGAKYFPSHWSDGAKFKMGIVTAAGTTLINGVIIFGGCVYLVLDSFG